jgi:spermidine synthase
MNDRWPSHFTTKTYLFILVFVSGITTLGIEMSTSRLIGNMFGNSNVVWAGVIAMTLFYLMVGYFIGGRLADRFPTPSAFLRLCSWAALSSGITPLLAWPILRQAAEALLAIQVGFSLASSLLVAVLFAVPITLLGAVPPFAIRLMIRSVDHSGSDAGRVYAVTTAGSLIGTFTPTLVLIPSIGTLASFAVYAGLLLVITLFVWAKLEPQSWLRQSWMPAALLALCLIVLGEPLKAPPEGTILLHERETRYNYVQVVEDPDGARMLLLNEGLAIHSIYNPRELQTFGSWDYFLAAPYANPAPFTPAQVDRIAVLGLATGTVAHQYTEVYGDIPIDGVEIDGGIVEVGREYFDMTMPNLNVIVEDARFALRGMGNDYQMIGIDAYRPPYIPWQLTTVEFFEEVQARLADDGVVVVNVGRTYQDRRLVEAMTATLLQVFPTVHTFDVPSAFNSILIGTNQPSDQQDMIDNFIALNRTPDTQPLLLATIELALTSRVETQASNLVFTDDLAPVEFISDSIVLQFVLGENAAQLRQQLVPEE